jgi:hypothetical protein
LLDPNAVFSLVGHKLRAKKKPPEGGSCPIGRTDQNLCQTPTSNWVFFASDV